MCVCVSVFVSECVCVFIANMTIGIRSKPHLVQNTSAPFPPRQFECCFSLLIFWCSQIVFGGTIHLRKKVWEKIRSSTRDSLFIKELAVAVWGTKTLEERSLTGKECPTTKSQADPLTQRQAESQDLQLRGECRGNYGVNSTLPQKSSSGGTQTLVTYITSLKDRKDDLHHKLE
ncbi:hypothetical protein Q7C36_012527 [Tachysurus vachellii]|uniref:Uncharacterized protein n=1 Tax=Tachysurus vachellii TaxID=175792 RepID=A0AA88SRV3_TACVA|nr:hypothetical protein Q7C36_012527 [Tachysurus vachellii]